MTIAMFQTNAEKAKTAEYWRNLKPKSTILLTDAQSIELATYNNLGKGGVNYIVKEIAFFNDLDADGNEGLCEWVFAELAKEGFDNLYLMVKTVSGYSPECRIYYKPQTLDDKDNKIDLVPSGDRNDLIEWGNIWIFQEEDLSKYTHLQLSFTNEVKYAANEEDEQTVYVKKPAGDVFANCIQKPSLNKNALVATIVEYSTAQVVFNPEALFIEIGTPENEYGGNINFYLGSPIDQSEITVLAF